MSCSEEQDIPVPEQTSALHITSVTIDGQDVARSRVVADGGEYPDGIPFNQSFNGFTQGNALQLTMEGTTSRTAYAIYNADGTWSMSSDNESIIPVTIIPAEDKTWADVSIIEAAFGGEQIAGEVYPIATQGMGIVQGDIPEASSIIYSDWLVASTSAGTTASTTAGTITLDKDVKSATLGAATIELTHAHALLRLPKSAVSITPGTYIKDGTAYNVTGLGTLWAVVKIGNAIQYIPLTAVTTGEADYLQAIVPADNDGAYTLTGFKAVMKVTDSSGASATLQASVAQSTVLPSSGHGSTFSASSAALVASNLEEESVITTRGISNSPSKLEGVPEGGGSLSTRATASTTVTLDLPFKVGESETHDADGITLTPNTRYPLTLTIEPHRATVTLADGLGKYGWSTDDNKELSNEMNESVVIDGE